MARARRRNLSWLDQLGPSCREHGTDPVPGDHFFRALESVRMTISTNLPHIMSWSQLYNTVWGLMLLVTGADRGDEHDRILTSDVDAMLVGKLARGTLRYTVPRMVDLKEVDRAS